MCLVSTLDLVKAEGLRFLGHRIEELHVCVERLVNGPDPAHERRDTNPTGDPDLFLPTEAVVETSERSPRLRRCTGAKFLVQLVRELTYRPDRHLQDPVRRRAGHRERMSLPSE